MTCSATVLLRGADVYISTFTFCGDMSILLVGKTENGKVKEMRVEKG